MKNKELNSVLIYINGNGAIPGLRNEKLAMGVRLSLLKISKEIESSFNDYAAIRDEKVKEYYPNFLDEVEAKRLEESQDETFLKMIQDLKEFDDLDASVNFEKIDIKKLEDVVTDFDYSVLLELICK